MPWRKVFESVTFGAPRRERQDGVETVKGLDGALFIDTENSCMGRRLQVEEVSEVLCLGSVLFFFGWPRFARRGSAQQFPPSRGVMGARSPHSKGVSLIC